MDSSDSIASLLAPFISLRRTPETVDRYAALLDTLTPVDVRDMAAKYFREESRTVVTLATKSGTDAAKNEPKGGGN